MIYSGRSTREVMAETPFRGRVLMRSMVDDCGQAVGVDGQDIWRWC